MKHKLSGLKNRRQTVKRSNPDLEPGTLLGDKTCCCFRCKAVLPVRSLRAFPAESKPGQSRILLCDTCIGEGKHE